MNTPYSMTPIASRTRPPVTILGIARTICTVLAPALLLTMSNCACGDQIPQFAVLLLVLRPNLLLRQLLEWRMIRHVHGHAQRFEQSFGLGQRIDAFRVLAHDRLGLSRAVEHQLLLIGPQCI